MSKTSARPELDLVGEQHRRLRESVAGLRSFLAEPRPAPASKAGGAWTNGLARRLTDFDAELRRHFKTEERSAMLEELSSGNATAARAIARLIADHERILIDLRKALHATTSGLGRAPRRLADPRHLALAALDHLEQHDQAESEWMQGQLCDEFGAGD